MPIFNLPSIIPPPEGWHGAELTGLTDTKTKYGEAIEWCFTLTDCERDDGKPWVLRWFTSRSITPKSKAGALIEELGFDPPQTEDELDELEAELFKQRYRVLIKHVKDETGVWARIKQVRPSLWEVEDDESTAGV